MRSDHRSEKLTVKGQLLTRDALSRGNIVELDIEASQAGVLAGELHKLI